ncbi:SDR family NAD(P)-dependent oxidoreductase [Actinocatenispora rupis]|uniref:Oxidoreductase n=1 Tax=Actinocatenispora rupis TaxID=519421 RepID=A0A8J3JAW9_9ACTN|nr:SDR family oxidoreductase [Actinocatenispora rupis]GID13227.1 oxidoreductase [Actinocatenispora rupis]
MSMTGRVALVTGGGHGIGRATVAALRAKGALVAAADVDLAAARAVADDTDGVLAVRLDVTDRSSVDAGIARCVEHFGRLDCLVSTAGGDRETPEFAEMSDDDWSAAYELNLLGVVRCVRAAVPHLGEGGSVVVVGSVNGLAAWGSEPYSVAKAGLGVLVQNLAASYGPRGVRVNLVAPGTIRTRVWDGQGGPDRLAPMYPLGRVGEPADVANAVAFLASPDAGWITGVTLPVDGGVSTGPIHLLRDRW